ncbi:MAG: DUF3426 domain-containing protein [Steroidobacteraceae bacterium]
MLTQCPSCQTVFRVTSTILRAAHGQVRCGRCDTQFDAIQHLLDEDEADSIDTPTALQPPTDNPDDSIHSSTSVAHEDIVMEGNRLEISGVYPHASDDMDARMSDTHTTIEEFNLSRDEWDVAQASLSTKPDATQDNSSDTELDDVEAVLSETELFGALNSLDEYRTEDEHREAENMGAVAESTQPHREQETPLTEINPWLKVTPQNAPEPFLTTPSEPHHWPWAVTSILLGLGLAAQLLHHYRQDLSRHPSVGPQLTRLYAAVGQPLAPQWDINFYSIKQWGIVSDPQTTGTLRVRASVTNGAPFAQPYPLLQLSLEDRFGSNVGSRAFKPDEYLSNRAQATRLLAAGESANIDLAIVDPGQDAVGFQFDTCLSLTSGLRCTHAGGG